jgi:hypothetical protein
MRYVGTARIGHINSSGNPEHGSTLVLPIISCITLGLALLEDEQKFIKHQFYASTCQVNV